MADFSDASRSGGQQGAPTTGGDADGATAAGGVVGRDGAEPEGPGTGDEGPPEFRLPQGAVPDGIMTDVAFRNMAAVDREAAEALRQEWGPEAAKNLSLARAVAEEFGGSALEKALQESGLGNHPVVIRAAAAIGRALSRAPIASGRTPGGKAPTGREARTIGDRIDALHKMMHTNPRAYVSDEVQAELQALYNRLYGNGPVVGSDMRTL